MLFMHTIVTCNYRGLSILCVLIKLNVVLQNSHPLKWQVINNAIFHLCWKKTKQKKTYLIAIYYCTFKFYAESNSTLHFTLYYSCLLRYIISSSNKISILWGFEYLYSTIITTKSEISSRLIYIFTKKNNLYRLIYFTL